MFFVCWQADVQTTLTMLSLQLVFCLTGETAIDMVRCLVLVQTSPREEKNYKVRDVKYNRNMGRLASLTTNGCVQFWDPHATFERNVRGPSPPLS